MADRTHDIWNDNDGEEKKPKKRRGLRRFLTFFLILAVVLGVVLVAAYRDGTGFDVLRRYLNYGGVETVGGEVIYRYDASPGNRFAVLGDELVVLSETKLSILDRNGEVWSVQVNLSAPALSGNGSRVVAYDVGGTELYVLDHKGELLHLTTGEEEPFIAATLNRSGWLAVTTKKTSHKAWVTVYDAELEKAFEFKSSEHFLTDARVTDDNKILAAVTLGEKDGTFASRVVLYDLQTAESTGSYEVADGLVALLGQQEDTLAAVADTCLTFAKRDGSVTGQYRYDGEYLRGMALEGDGFTALLLNRYQSGSVGRLVTVAPDGTVLARLDMNREVLGISAEGRYLAVLYTDQLVIYNQSLQTYASLTGTDFASGVLMRPDGSALLLSSEYAGLFLP